MSARLLFTNSALTTLAAPITSTATTATLAVGTGSLFPNPGTNQEFLMTFKDAATGLVREIVLVTAMSGDTIVQMARAQEGTTASSYLAGDIAGQYNTAGTQARFQQAPVSILATASQTINAAPTSIKYNLTAGAVTQALPSISSMAAFDGLTVELWKSDVSANALTVTSADGFVGFSSPLTVANQGQSLIVEVSVSLSKWLVKSFEIDSQQITDAIDSAPAAATLIGTEVAGIIQGGVLVQTTTSDLGGITPRTAAEIAAGVTPVNYAYAPYNLFRYMTSAQVIDVLAGTLTQDVTIPLQTWLNLCALAEIRAKGYGLCKITGALTYSGNAGIDWDCLGYDSTTINGGIVPSGSGYIALTVTGVVSYLNIVIAGTGNAVNGLYLNNPTLLRIANIRVMNLAGFGLRIDECFDCAFQTISVQQCGAGTGALAAFSVNDGASTSNESFFGRVQVELTNSNMQAMFVSGNTINCAFSLIHSERAQATSSMTMWSLGGTCTYGQMRLNTLGSSANCKVLLNGIGAKYTGLRAEGNIPVLVDCSGGTSTLINPSIFGTYTENPSQTGNVSIVGGSIAALAAGAQISNTRFFDTLVAGVIPGTAITYVPTWTSTGIAPTLGNGILTGEYWLSGTDNKLCNVRIQWTAGSTTTFGTGGYLFSLPLTSANNGFQSGGDVWINNSGVQIEGARSRVQSNSAVIDMWYANPATASAFIQLQVGSAGPHTFKLADQIMVTAQYPVP